MLRELDADLRAASKAPVRDLRGMALALFSRPALCALVAHRLGGWLRASWGRPARWPAAALVAPTYAVLTGFSRAALDSHIASSARLGPGITLHHFGGLRLRGCRVGARCVIHHGVWLEPGADGRGPELGDRVWVGPHARIVGPIRVGDGATIGAGAIVKRDVPAGAVVLGDPTRVVRYRYDNSGLLAR